MNRNHFLTFKVEGFGFTKMVNRGVRVRCVETGQEYPSISAAAKAIGRAEENIHQSLKLGCHCGGYHWERVNPKPLASEAAD
eukprot:g2446.t1